VKERGGDRGGVKLQVSQDRGHLEGVVHVVLAREAVLAVVGARGPLEGPPDHGLVLRVEVVGDPEQLGNGHFVPGMKFKFGI